MVHCCLDLPMSPPEESDDSDAEEEDTMIQTARRLDHDDDRADCDAYDQLPLRAMPDEHGFEDAVQADADSDGDSSVAIVGGAI